MAVEAWIWAKKFSDALGGGVVGGGMYYRRIGAEKYEMGWSSGMIVLSEFVVQ